MRYLKPLYLLLGLALLVFVLLEVDLAELTQRVVQVGWGIGVVLAIYFVEFLIDSMTWHITLPRVALDATWLYRLWKVRMVGEVFNNVIPAGGMGGEPVKAVLLKRHYGIGYRDATASLILSKTINLIALVVFLIVGFVLMLSTPQLSATYKTLGGVGLSALVFGVGGFFFVQRLKLSSVAGLWLSQRRIGRRIEGALGHIRDMDDRLAWFYSRHRGRFAWAILLAFSNWLLGVLEIYYTMVFLGHPISLADAWIIESVAQLVRAGSFFIPASIGAQEGAFLLVCSAIVGSPVLGVAVAVVRRFREILWILWGLAVGSVFTLRPVLAKGPLTENEKTEHDS